MDNFVQSFIIAAKDKKKQEDYTLKICTLRKINSFDISIIQKEGSIGIEDIRNLKEKIFLKPLKSQTKAVIIKIDENITVEAQNALLKILEEPPDNTIIILTIEKSDLLLPTILSRCKVIELQTISKSQPRFDQGQLLILTEGTLGKKLKLAQDIAKTKEEAITWLETMIIMIRQELTNLISSKTYYNDTYHYSEKIRALSSALKILKTTNINPRFALENLFLSFDGI